MTTIIISDIHNHVSWIERGLEKLKKDLNYDEVVFLGDYFDDFGDDPFAVKGTAHWLQQSLQHKDRIHLLGNHDMPYMCPINPSLCCPGYNPDKGRAVRSVMTEADWSHLKAAYFTQGFVLSHAGFQEDVVDHPLTGLPDEGGLIALSISALAQVKTGLPHPLFLPGSRMGADNTGGVTWCDWDDEFQAYAGISQIVGHTPGKKVRQLVGLNCVNYCMDTNNQHIGIITDGVVEFKLRSQLLGF